MRKVTRRVKLFKVKFTSDFLHRFDKLSAKAQRDVLLGLVYIQAHPFEGKYISRFNEKTGQWEETARLIRNSKGGKK